MLNPSPFTPDGDPAYPSPPFDSWPAAIYRAGWDMGARHAVTGDPRDMSDARCKPLESELDTAAMAYPFGVERAAFYGGYEAGYESRLPRNFHGGR